MRRTDTLIVGGGPAGAAAAIALTRASQRPLLIERDRQTRDALCGGFLSWPTIDRLQRLGIDPWQLGAPRIDRLRLFAGHRHAETALPAPAAALSRRALDSALLDHAARLGCAVERGVAARDHEDGRLKLGDGAEIAAERIILATGKHELRGLARPRAGNDAAIGLRWRLAASPALTRWLAGRIEVHLFRGGYAGLVLQEDGTANLCVALRHSRFVAAGQQPAPFLAEMAAECPALGERLALATAIGPAQAIAQIPYGWRARSTDPGLYRVGDQAAVIPSFAGEGIGIALASGMAAAEAILRSEPAGPFQLALAGRTARPIRYGQGLAHIAAHPAGAALLVGAVGVSPVLARLAARLTRID